MAIKRDYKKSQLNQNFVAKNTKFRFRCTECGECCRNVEKEDKILLSAVDIYRAAKYLNLEVQTFIGMHCELVPGGESMLPLLVMKQRLDGSCTFLRKGKCTIHDAKPIPCSVFPLGRMLFLNDTTQEHDFHYYLEDLTALRRRIRTSLFRSGWTGLKSKNTMNALRCISVWGASVQGSCTRQRPWRSSRKCFRQRFS